MYPRLLHFGEFSLYTYGVLVALALVVGLIVTTRLARRSGLDPDDTWNLGIYTVLSALLCAKVFLLITEWNHFKVHPRDIFSFSMLQSGGVWFGGIAGGLLMAFFYMRRRHMPALRTCDVFAPGLALGHAIGRLGCFAAGCCYGKPTDLPWGVTFNNPLAYELVKTPLGVHLHPTQLYESGFELMNFAFLMWLTRHKRFDGQIMGAYMFTYGVARYFIDFVRQYPDSPMLFHGTMTPTQLIALFLVAGGGILWMLGLRRMPAPAAAAR